MPDQAPLENNYRSTSDTFIKLLLYRIIIVFTIVFTLLNAQIKMEDKEITSKVKEIKALKKISGYVPFGTDVFVDAIFFNTDPDEVTGADDDTTNQVTDSVRNAAADRQNLLLKQIGSAMKTSYLLQLPFFNNTSVDLRYWLFVLPILYIFSSIFLHILNIQVKIIKRKAILAESDITTFAEYPNKYLKDLLLGLEFIMVIIFLRIFSEFIKYNSSEINTIIISAYILVIYFSLIYTLYTSEKLKRLELKAGYKPTVVISFLAAAYSFIIHSFKKINPYAWLRAGIIFLGATLFLVMSYDSCSDSEHYDAKYAKKGYELLTHKWKQVGSGDIGPTFYQYLYIIVLITGIFLVLINISKVRNFFLSSNSGLLFLILKCGVLSTCFLFTVYFGFYHLHLDDIFPFMGLILLFHWYVNFNQSFFKRDQLTTFNISYFSSYVLYLLPFIISGFINTLIVFHLRNGWIFFLMALWLNVFGITFLETYKKGNR